MINQMRFDKDYYYIHRHISNFEKDDAVTAFEAQKTQNYLLSKNRFRENYLQSISATNPEGLAILNAAMSSDEILNDLDKSLLDILNSRVSEAIQKHNLNEKIAKAYDSLNSYIKTKDVQALGELFSRITEATNLLRSDLTALTAIVSQKNLQKNNYNLSKITTLLNQYLASLNGSNIRVAKKELVSVATSLRNLTIGLEDPHINAASLQKYLGNIFSTQIGEYVVSKGVKEAFQLTQKELQQSLVGDMKIIPTKSNLTELESFGQKRNTTFKTDNKFKDVSVTLNESGAAFDIDLGISTKWYKNMGASLDDRVSITTESDFMYRVNQLLSNDQGRYYAYNALALVNQDGTPYAALKSAIIARTIDYLLSGFGSQGDFAQFIVINGKFFSIWQIISLLETNNAGQGASVYTNGKTDPITVSAAGLSKVTKLTSDAQNHKSNTFKAYQRAKEQNKMINQLRFVGHFYPNRLKNLV